jgi:hypothetical protein
MVQSFCKQKGNECTILSDIGFAVDNTVRVCHTWIPKLIHFFIHDLQSSILSIIEEETTGCKMLKKF